MKIDLHCHTIKTKSGEDDTRNVTKEKFLSILEGKVGLVAITNHNYFNIDQYKDFRNNDSIIVWPGIEIDIVEGNNRYHCIVISNPDEIASFYDIVSNYKIEEADDFSLSLNEFIETYKNLDCIIIAHYLKKDHAFKDEMVSRLINGFNDRNVFVEPQNLRSATILQAHNYRCLVGSDIHDWDKYNVDELPSFKKNIDSFNRLKLLLKKDVQIIKTTLKEELYDEIKISPFAPFKENNADLTFNIYRDVNVFFGGKGTGKSDILSHLKNYFETKNGVDSISYYKAKSVKDSFEKFIKNSFSEEEFNKLQIREVKEDVEVIKEWQEPMLTLTSDYYMWKKIESTNKNNALLKIRDATFIESITTTQIDDLKNDLLEIKQNSNSFIMIVDDNKLLDENNFENLCHLHKKTINKLNNETLNEWLNYRALLLEKYTIEKFKSLSENKTGEKSRPSGLGLFNTYDSLKRLKKAIHNVECLPKEAISPIRKPIGELEEKGIIYLSKEVTFDTNKTGYKFTQTKDKVGKIYNALRNCKGSIYSPDLFNHLSELKAQLNDIKNSYSFVAYKTTIIQGDENEYMPSDGEQAMLILSNSIIDDSKLVYILDEPELSVGHQYVNEIIIPKVKELAKLRKIIIIATHDANIAVRTLPYLSVYRKYKNGQYYTYIGSALEDKMLNVFGSDCVDWTEVSINTLEGGRDSFDERGVIYG